MADHVVHRSHSQQSLSGGRTENERPEDYYGKVESLGDLDLNHAIGLIAEQYQEIAQVRRNELVGILDEIVRNRSSSVQPRSVLLDWARGVCDKLDTPDHPGWDYYYDPNYERLREYFENLRDSKRHPVKQLFHKEDDTIQIVNSAGPLKNYTVDKIWDKLKLKDLIEGRKEALMIVFAYIMKRLNLGECDTVFMIRWQGNIEGSIRSNPQNYEHDHYWYRIEALLGYIHDRVKHKRDGEIWTNSSAIKRLDAFQEKYKWEDIVAKLHLAPPLPKMKTRDKFLKPFGRRGQGSSSQSSLSHGHRLGLRQIQMRGLEPLEKAEDGGYYF